MNKTFTLTFGDRAENHAGMQQIGELHEHGYSEADLLNFKKEFEGEDFECELVDLNLTKTNFSSAKILIIRNFVQGYVELDGIYNEHNNLPVDKKALMRNKVVNKKARHNLCFNDTAQEPDYENGKGRIVAWDTIPTTNTLREYLSTFINGFGDLKGEGNYYYDVEKCYIGFHGDSERKKVIAVRLGQPMNLYYQWYQRFEPVGNMQKFVLNHGDVYIMGEKATGNDWKKSSILTLRHAAGSEAALKL
jgi:hypothetical protein